MSLRDEMGSEALRGAQRKKKRNGFRSLERSTTRKKKKKGSEAWTGARQVGVKKKNKILGKYYFNRRVE